MTKKEIIDFLRPFDDEIEVDIEMLDYAVEPDGTGIIYAYQMKGVA